MAHTPKYTTSTTKQTQSMAHMPKYTTSTTKQTQSMAHTPKYTTYTTKQAQSRAHTPRYTTSTTEQMELNSFLRCTQLNAPCTGLWHGDLQERMHRCFGLFLSTAVMTHRAPSPMWGLPASLTVGLFLSTITHSSWCPLFSPISSD